MTTQRPENSNIEENFIRSANAPVIRAGVMMANVIWNVMKTVSGIVPLIDSLPNPFRNAELKPPTKAFAAPPSENAME